MFQAASRQIRHLAAISAIAVAGGVTAPQAAYATPSSEADLKAFVRTNAGKFASEVAGLPKQFTVRAPGDKYRWDLATYDPAKQALTDATGITVDRLELYERCRTTGTFTGQNSFGVKRTITDMACETLTVEHSGAWPGILIGVRDCSSTERIFATSPPEVRAERCRESSYGSLEIPMDPSTYRQIKAKGVIYELELEVRPEASKEVAERKSQLTTPTITFPFRKRIDQQVLNAEFKRLKVYTPDGKTLLGTFDF
jgi:hypothetical protein